MASKDLGFGPMLPIIIGLYPHPPQYSAVFCVEQKTAIQALARKNLVLCSRRNAPNDMALSITAGGTLSLLFVTY
jgi:hypothetical protein